MHTLHEVLARNDRSLAVKALRVLLSGRSATDKHQRAHTDKVLAGGGSAGASEEYSGER